MADVERAVAELADLVAFRSLSLEPNGEIAHHVARRLSDAGFRVGFDRDDSGERMNVIATIGPDRPGGIVLCGHLDVVPANTEGWVGDPFKLRRDNDRLIGRGAVDMKGFIACCLAWAPDAAALSDALSVPVHMIFTFDEEVGSFGAAQVGAYLDRVGLRPAIAIVGEPTRMRPVAGHRGILELTTEVRGSAGHASDPRGKVNAIAHAAAMIAHIEDLALRLAASPVADTPFAPAWTTLSVGRIEGGEARNVIPDSCRFDWEIRPLPGEDGLAILREIGGHAERLAAGMRALDPAAGIATTLVADCRGLAFEPGSRALGLVRDLWRDREPQVVSFATDAGYLQAAGIDTVVFGPGDLARAHKPEEYITVGELGEGLAFMDHLLAYLVR